MRSESRVDKRSLLLYRYRFGALIRSVNPPFALAAPSSFKRDLPDSDSVEEGKDSEDKGWLICLGKVPLLIEYDSLANSQAGKD